MDTDNKTRDEKIIEVLSNFRFDKVHTAMVAVEWKWTQPDNSMRIPTRDELVTKARELLERVWAEKGTCRTGGFSAWCENDSNGLDDEFVSFGLSFTLEWSDIEMPSFR